MQPESLFDLSRILPWDDSLNSRELGGYPTSGGGRLRWKALVRSETTWLLKPAGQQALLDYGIRTVIDLRFPSELEVRPSPFARPGANFGPNWPDYIQIPLETDQDSNWHGEGSPAAAIQDLYCRLLETNRGHVAAVLSATALARPGGVLFHCHAGKDRTGLISAMILGAAGVSRDVIVQDYAFAHPKFLERRERDLLNSNLSPQERESEAVMSTIYPETMSLTLDYLDRRYGGVEGYLATTPLRADVLDTLLERFVEKPL